MTDTMKVAISTNDYKNLARDSFGRSHFYLVYRREGDDWTQDDVRENILFMQSCELQGRVDHLHGLLGDVDVLIGHSFEPDIEERLKELGHRLLESPVAAVEQVLTGITRETTARTD